MASVDQAICGVAFVVLASLLLNGCEEGANYDDYTFTVNVDDIQEIAKDKAIQIKRKANAAFELNEDHNLQIIGVVGHKNVGKTWLINKLFEKKLRTGKSKTKVDHGLSMLHIPEESWLIVKMLGSIRSPKIDLKNRTPARGKELVVDQYLIETYRYMIMEELCHAIIFVVEDYYYHSDPLANSYVRLSHMIERASENTFKEKPIMMVAHNFKSVETIQDAKNMIIRARAEFEGTFESGRVSTRQDLQSGEMKFNVIFSAGTEETIVETFGFAKDDRAMNTLNGQSRVNILNSLQTKIPVPKKVNMTNALQDSMQKSLHYFFDGKAGMEDWPVSFSKDHITIVMEGERLRITGVNYLACKDRIVEARKGKNGGALMIRDTEYAPSRNFKIHSDTTQVDEDKRLKIRTFKLEIPGIPQANTNIYEKDGKVYLEVTKRSRRPLVGRVRPMADANLTKNTNSTNKSCRWSDDAWRCTELSSEDVDRFNNDTWSTRGHWDRESGMALFAGGISKMVLPFDGWSFNVRDSAARRLLHGVYSFTLTQEL